MLHKGLNNTVCELYNQAYMYVKQLHRSEPTFVVDLTWPQGRFMNGQNYKKLYWTIFNFRKILKIQEFFFGDKMLMNFAFIKRRNRKKGAKRPDISVFYILFSPEVWRIWPKVENHVFLDIVQQISFISDRTRYFP